MADGIDISTYLILYYVTTPYKYELWFISR